MRESLTVRLLVGANAYACIATPARSIDVLLAPGRSAAQSLRESAAEMRADAARLVARADLCERAAAELSREVA